MEYVYAQEVDRQVGRWIAVFVHSFMQAAALMTMPTLHAGMPLDQIRQLSVSIRPLASSHLLQLTCSAITAER
jgi:hypothetical protein